MSRNRMYRINIQENHNHNNKFILTIKQANKGQDVRLGIENDDTLQSVKEFLFNKKNDFDDLRDCEECKENIYFFRHGDDGYELFESSDFNRANQNVDVIIFTIAPIQVNYNGKTHDIRCLPDVSSVRDEMIKIYPALKKFIDIGYIAMPLEIIEGEFIDIGHFLPIIAKKGNKRVLKMSVLTNDQLKPMIVNSTVDGVSYQPVSIGDEIKSIDVEIIKNKLQLVERQFIQLQNELKKADQRKSGMKAVLNIDPPFSNTSYPFYKFLYATTEGWYDIVEVTGESQHNIQGMRGRILSQLSLLPIKKIVISLNAYALRQMEFIKFLEVTTIPMIDLKYSPDWRMMEDIADAIEKNENIMHFKGLDLDKNNEDVLRINKKLRLNRDRRDFIRSLDVGLALHKQDIGVKNKNTKDVKTAGHGVDSIIRGFLS